MNAIGDKSPITRKRSASTEENTDSKDALKRPRNEGTGNVSKGGSVGHANSWVKGVPSMTLNEEQRVRLEKAKAFARDARSVILKSKISSDVTSPPGLPAVLMSTNSILSAGQGVDMRSLAVLSRIYVGSINFELNESHIKAVFEQFGAIKAVSMTMDPATGKHKGYCFVEFETPEASVLALEAMNGAELGGRILKVGRPHNYSAASLQNLPTAPKSRIYISNVSEHISEEILQSIFYSLGSIKGCALIPDLVTRKHKGFGFIEFEDDQAAKTAIASLNNFELAGLCLHVAPAIVGGPLSEGMKALDKLPPPPAVSIPLSVTVRPDIPPVKPIITNSITASANAAAAAAAQSVAAKIAANLIAQSKEQAVESVDQEENMSIGASQRYAIMQKLAASREEVSPVLLVRNAVSISGVDDALQEEFTEECSNYGKVVKVVIQARACGDEEMEAAGLGTGSGRSIGDGDVRIFVQFDSNAAAERARQVLNQRWFGGRKLAASIYDFRKFKAGDYWL